MTISDLGHLRVRYSGGAGNTLQSGCLGGAVSSSNRVVSNDCAPQLTPDTVTGWDFFDACGTGAGTGRIKHTYTAPDHFLAWQSPGDAYGSDVQITESGVYTLRSAATGYVFGDATLGALPVATVEEDVAITRRFNSSFDDVSKSEATAGDVEYRCFYLFNSHASDTVFGARIWLISDASGDDSLELGIESSNPAQVIATEGTAPTAVVFSAPASYATGLILGDIAPNTGLPFWIKRTVPPGTTTSTSTDISLIGFGGTFP